MASEQHTPPRRFQRRWLFALGALVAALVVAVPLAWASHQFTDVPDENPFHTEIGNLAGAGITAGKTCVPPGTPPTFCPDEPVVRQAMAAFLNRGLGRASAGTPFVVAIGDDFVELANLTIVVGGTTGGTQFVKVDAAVATFIGEAAGCPCSTAFAIFSDAENDFVSEFQFALNDSMGDNGFGDESGALTTVVPVDTGTTQTFRVVAIRDSLDPPPSTGAVSGYASMSAITGAYGSTGSSTVGGTLEPGGRRPAGITKRP